MVESPKQPSEEAVLEALRQAGESQRAYMDLRYKHFSTFVVVTTLLGVAAFQVDQLAGLRWLPALLAAVITALFWKLDSRTAAYQRAASERVAEIEESMAVPSHLPSPKKSRFGASKVTNALFALMLVWWVATTFIVSTSLPAPTSKGGQPTDTDSLASRPGL